MTTALDRSTTDTVAWLRTVCRDGVAPREAEARLRHLADAHPDLPMELVWEREAYDEQVHYDVLLRLPEGATLSLGYSPPRMLPWPLRGARRWSERDLVRVNGVLLQVGQAIAFLDFVWNEAPLAERLIDACLVQEELAREPVVLTDEDLETGIDELRRAHGLLSAEDTVRWMDQRGLSREQLERIVGDNLVVARVRARVTEGRVDRWLADHPDAGDQIRVARIASPDPAALVARIREIGFYEAAEEAFARGHGATFVVLGRDEVPAAVSVGEVVVHDGAVLRIVSVARASPEETRAAVEKRLFAEWLTERRAHARIEWFWGRD